ncbi:MAG: DUF3365 domain-containing protein [Pirellulales bacterium]
MRKRVLAIGTAAIAAAALVAAPWATNSVRAVADDKAVAAAEPSSEAIARTRKQVKMLDDLYKTAVVLITTHYVNDEDDLAAGSAAVALFDAMKKKGWHEVRLLDATGQPIEDKNAPSDEFEKSAVAKLKNGETFVEQVIERDGKPYLRAATPIPVVLDKCIMCHEHYKDFKAKGQIIGALGYTLPIE